MNLLMLNYEFPPIGGGAANAHLHLVTEYANIRELRVDILTSAPQPGFYYEKFADNISIYKVGVHKKHLHFWRRTEVIEWLLKARTHYRRLVRENSYDLVHAFFGFPTGWLCRRTAKKLPYIISLRGSDVPGSHARLTLDYKILGPVFKSIWKNAAALVACSKGLKQRALRFLPSVSIEVIPNGVDLGLFHAPTASDSEAPANSKQPLRLLTVGRLSVTKRVEMLIEAVDLLKKQGLNVRLTIVGGGAAEPRLRQLVRTMNLADMIEITGRISPEKMPEIYRQNDIFITATMQEGMSNAMLEAMACGLPIITTSCEGTEELIADNGIVLQQAHPEAFVRALSKFVDDRESYTRLSNASTNRAASFTWASVANMYVRLYEKVLKGSRCFEQENLCAE